MGTAERFWSHVETDGPDNCWEWQGHRDRLGYGHSGSNKNGSVLAHRKAWAFTFGEVPEGLCVCHKCDNRACCNPAHLWLGTHSQNIQDMFDKGRGRKGMDHKDSKLNPETIKVILADVGAGVGIRELGRRYNVAHTTILRVVQGKSWRGVGVVAHG